MKILELAPYVFVDGHPYASKNQSGLAYMIRNVADMLSDDNDVYVLTQSILTPKMRVGKWTLLKRNFFTILRYFRFRYLHYYFVVFSEEPSVKMKLRALLYFISAGQVENEIKRLAPDVIHIHGIGSYTLPYFLVASKFNIPVLTTLHGLLSFHDIIPVTPYIKRLERNFLDMFVKEQYSMTFISSGMKRKVEEYCNGEAPNITVIPNSYKKSNTPIALSTPGNKKSKHLICIGSVYELKNHTQVIRIMPELQTRFKDKCDIFLDILGDGPLKSSLENLVTTNNIRNISFRGRVSKEQVYEQLLQSDLLVFPSIEEGFGLPIIEAYRCGIPVVAFRDIDAAEDVADQECIIFPKDRTDKALCDSIETALETIWNPEKIHEYSKKFLSDNIGKQYNLACHNTHKRLDSNVMSNIILNSISKHEQ